MNAFSSRKFEKELSNIKKNYLNLIREYSLIWNKYLKIGP